MIDRILAFSIANRWLVIILALGGGTFGAWNFTRLPIDAVPDITNVQVQVNSVAPGYSPLEIEQRITFPIETGMGGLPRLSYTRSLSRYGLSQVTVVFEDGTTAQLATPMSLAPHSRTTIPMGVAFPSVRGKRFGTIVESLGATPAQIVVERALYNDAVINGQTVIWAAGSNAIATRLR